MSTAKLGTIVAALPLESSSSEGHDQIVFYVQDDVGVEEVWETVSDSVCERGRNKGRSFKEARLEELGVSDFASAEADLVGRRAILAHVARKRDGEVQLDNTTGEPIFDWILRRVLPPA